MSVADMRALRTHAVDGAWLLVTKVKFFWRKGWTEIPVIMGSSFFVVIGTAVMTYTAYYSSTHDQTPKYFCKPRIYRPDDPRVQTIRTTSKFDL